MKRCFSHFFPKDNGESIILESSAFLLYSSSRTGKSSEFNYVQVSEGSQRLNNAFIHKKKPIDAVELGVSECEHQHLG